MLETHSEIEQAHDVAKAVTGGRSQGQSQRRKSCWPASPNLRSKRCLRRRKFVVTTDSGHGLPVYPNVARTLTLSGLDQLWVADITYIRLELEFVYLAVILDAFSRRVIGWALDRTLEAALTLEALHRALARRRGRSTGLVHHSDRGVQYASADYTQLLTDHGIRISMSRKANPWDNAACESFMKTLKYEEVYRSEYRDLAEAQASAPPSSRHPGGRKF